MELAVSRESVAGASVLSVRGEVDVYSAPTLRDNLTELLESGAEAVVVDLTEVAFLDSTGLGALIGARTEAENSGGRLALVCTNDRILKLFTITGLDSVFSIYEGVDEAVAGITG
ncbi:MAG: STAS domain-containing protein [Jatrophihabitans sp.]|uniref:STAS domain-containing protein n=1 Tax=Jatrophihabitans sp. TaxID=1932789 RepID=UPI003F7F1DC8